MKATASRNMRLGIMVIAGLSFLIVALYLIGDRQNLFGSTIIVKSKFSNVNGLTVGNNVRFVGIDIGTVNSIEIVNDSTVLVEMIVESDAMTYIRTNAITSIGTDGLMGNKLVNIHSVEGNAPLIVDGSILESIAPLDTDKIMRTLSETNTEVFLIAQNLKDITDKVQQENVIWKLLEDSLITLNIRSTMNNLDYVSRDLSAISTSFRKMANDIENGKGLVGSLLYDSTFIQKFDNTLTNLQSVSDSLGKVTHDISQIAEHVKKGEGAAGTILMDEKFEKDLNATLENVKNASKALNENMEALKHNILFRRYFKKQEE